MMLRRKELTLSCGLNCVFMCEITLDWQTVIAKKKDVAAILFVRYLSRSIDQRPTVSISLNKISLFFFCCMNFLEKSNFLLQINPLTHETIRGLSLLSPICTFHCTLFDHDLKQRTDKPGIVIVLWNPYHKRYNYINQQSTNTLKGMLITFEVKLIVTELFRLSGAYMAA